MTEAHTDSRFSIAVISLAGFSLFYYILMSFWSDGFYGHDEVTHYLAAVQFWKQPDLILGYWQRPGFKVIYVLPALGGVTAVHLLTALFTVATAVVTYSIARELDIRRPYFAMLFFAFQPLLVQLSFRLYSEVLAGLLIALILITYLKDHWRICALLAGYAFTVRQELALVGLVLLVLFLRKRDYLPIALLALGPVALAIFGWVNSGNPLWIVQDFLPVTEYDQVKPGFWHYWKHFAIIFGGPVTIFFLIGFFRPLLDRGSWRDRLSRNGPLYSLFVVFFLLQCLLTASFVQSPSPGHFRYLIYLAPVVALFANIGLNRVWDDRAGKRSLVLLGALWVYFAIFTTYHHNYYAYHFSRDVPSMVAFVILGLVLTFAIARQWRTGLVKVLASVLLFAYLFVSERPIALDSESAAAKECAEKAKESDLTQKQILTNHGVFAYWLGPELASGIKTPSLYRRTIDGASLGTLVVWDSHYGQHEISRTDVSADFIKGRTDLQPIAQCNGPKFQIVILEKVST